MCTDTEQVLGASYLTSLYIGIECLRVSFIPRRQNVQETRSGISRHAYLGGSYGLENGCYGARRRLFDYGERRITSTANTISERRVTSTANTVPKRRVTSTTDALLIATQ